MLSLAKPAQLLPRISRNVRRGMRGKRTQQGQALIYGLFVMTGGLAALFFLFNTGQLSSEKSKLVNTADAVAYSAGVMHARTLNFLAYTNRAMLANTVGIAQLVSLSSWGKYADMAALLGADLGNPLKYPDYFQSYAALLQRLSDVGLITNDLQNVAEVTDREIADVLRAGQTTAVAGLLAARQEVMNEVATANYRSGQDGDVTAEALMAGSDPFHAFVHRYSGSERGRFAELAETAAKLDRFQETRSWRLDAVYPNCGMAAASGRTDWIERRGGTELLGFDEWKAIDTMSEHVWKPRNSKDVFCRKETERVVGTGGQSASDVPAIDMDPRHYDQSLEHNVKGTALAMTQALSSSWHYSGIPAFFDLAQAWLESDEPALAFSVRVRRPIAQTRTSEGRSLTSVTPRLNNLHAAAASDELVGVATSRVYFRRPSSSCSAAVNASRRNCRGGNEIGSLFNPYWQVGLVQDESAAYARRLQGVLSP